MFSFCRGAQTISKYLSTFLWRRMVSQSSQDRDYKALEFVSRGGRYRCRLCVISNFIMQWSASRTSSLYLLVHTKYFSYSLTKLNESTVCRKMCLTPLAKDYLLSFQTGCHQYWVTSIPFLPVNCAYMKLLCSLNCLQTCMEPHVISISCYYELAGAVLTPR